MELSIPNYVILGLTLAGAVWGLFIGFSGALAFLCGLLVSVFSGGILWRFSAAYLAQPYTRGGAVLILGILIFGLIRLLVKKSVHFLLAQPGDALLGAILSGASAFLVSYLVHSLLKQFAVL